MAQKAWIITFDDRAIVDVVNARNKIGHIEEYLGMLYRLIHPESEENPAPARVSGTDINIGALRARLSSVDGAVYDGNEVVELEWQGLDYERFVIDADSLQGLLKH
jgi:hypothetical protein